MLHPMTIVGCEIESLPKKKDEKKKELAAR
jgi:hypothetical protein